MSDLETHGAVDAGTVTAEGAPPGAIEGKSPFQLAMGRLRRDKLTLVIEQDGKKINVPVTAEVRALTEQH